MKSSLKVLLVLWLLLTTWWSWYFHFMAEGYRHERDLADESAQTCHQQIKNLREDTIHAGT